MRWGVRCLCATIASIVAASSAVWGDGSTARLDSITALAVPMACAHYVMPNKMCCQSEHWRGCAQGMGLCGSSPSSARGTLLPALDRLTGLTALNLSENSLTEVPACLGKLPSLHILDLSLNSALWVRAIFKKAPSKVKSVTLMTRLSCLHN